MSATEEPPQVTASILDKDDVAESAPVVENDQSSDEEEAEQTQDGSQPKRRLGKTARKKLKQKAKKAAGIDVSKPAASSRSSVPAAPANDDNIDVIVEYSLAPATLPEVESNPEYAVFADVFKKFVPDFGSEAEDAAEDAEANSKEGEEADGDDAAGEGSDGETGAAKGMSNKERKSHLQDMVAALKREVAHPEVVESHDVTSADPKLLVHLKGYRNTVPVPRHWCHKRRYLQGKRGFVKPPFQLPDFILQTGIAKMRDADAEATDAKTLKSRTRERARPKMGRIEIDYQVLNDAFFKHQTKPRLCGYGEMYYEGKELEKNHDHAKPGQLSERLKTALGLTSEAMPPPWLLAMQRYGPPPSYPNLRICGLNAPLPHGASYGNQWGQWGYPPINEAGMPLYGDPFGVSDSPADDASKGAGAVKHHWGEPRDDTGVYSAYGAAYGVVEEAAASPEETAEAAAAAEEAGAASVIPEGAASVVQSISAGIETPDVVNLRKDRRGEETPALLGAGQKQLYQVLEQKETALAGGLLGTKHTYVLPGPGGAPAAVPGTVGQSSAVPGSAGGVAVNLSAEDVAAGKLSEADMAARYEAEAARAATGSSGRVGSAVGREDMSDLLEEQDRKARKRKAGDNDDGAKRAKKAAKDFKF